MGLLLTGDIRIAVYWWIFLLLSLTVPGVSLTFNLLGHLCYVVTSTFSLSGVGVVDCLISVLLFWVLNFSDFV